MLTMFLRSTIIATVLAAFAAAPALAQNEPPRLTEALKPCYVVASEGQREPVEIKAAGFTAFSRVDIFVDEVLQDQPPTLFDGSVDGYVKAPR